MLSLLDRVRKHAAVQGRPDLARHAEEFTGFKMSARQWRDFWGPNTFMAQQVPPVAGGQLLSMLPASAQQMPDLAVFANEVRGISEVIAWPLYSFKAYPTTGVLQLLFFDETEGNAQGRGNTNMLTAGALPGNQMFIAAALHVVPIPAAADVVGDNTVTAVAGREWYSVLRTNTWLEYKVSSKEVLVEGPITKFPTSFGVGNIQAGAPTVIQNVSTTQNGSPDNRAVYHLDPPIGLLPVRPFTVTLNWRALQTVTTAGRIGVIQRGWLIRAIL
jgi:hypothetical protein